MEGEQVQSVLHAVVQQKLAILVVQQMYQLSLANNSQRGQAEVLGELVEQEPAFFVKALGYN